MRDHHSEGLPPVTNPMADSITYPSAPNAYNIPSTDHYGQPFSSGNVHIVGAASRVEPQQRKRPKYTRSKTGCMTCRMKKIKCDETKPICMRCTHGQRDCTWPEGVPTRKKPTPKKEGMDGRPSTAESSGISEASTPPTRDSTPPRRHQSEYTLPPVVARRHSEPFVSTMGLDPDTTRRQLTSHGYPSLHHHPSQPSVLSMIPEMSTYPSSQPRFDSAYTGATAAIHAPPPRMAGPSHTSNHSLQMRPATQHHLPQQHWTHSQMLPALNVMEPFFHTPQERNLVGHPANDHHGRYQ